ncbi:MAG: FkbM family methyltransferase [Acidimicrobiia bacterium]|nr:FkbM family methyltransferase [Acidimicrobiia bacterium]
MTMELSLYAAKKALLSPRTAHRRRKAGEMAATTQQIFELSYYSDATFGFLEATIRNPDILVDADLDEHSVVLDVGAFVGQWCEKVVERYGATVHAFEPAPQAVAALRRRSAADPRIVTHPVGLSDRDTTATMEIHGPGSNVYSTTGEGDVVEIQLRDVAAVLDSLDVDRVDLLKVNIEGGEYDLFDRLIETGWLPRIRTVLVQFHEWHPGAYRRRFRIRRALSRHHRQVWNYPWMWEKWTRIGT